MSTTDKFRSTLRDALGKGASFADAIKFSVDEALAPPKVERKEVFFKGVKDAMGRGLSATDAIADALGGRRGPFADQTPPPPPSATTPASPTSLPLPGNTPLRNRTMPG